MTAQDRLNHAVFYALQQGCFFPVTRPRGKRVTVGHLKTWGALRSLHDAIKDFAAVQRADEGSITVVDARAQSSNHLSGGDRG